MYFSTFGPRKTRFDKFLKRPAEEDSLTSNMVKGPKPCWNLNDSTFIIFIDHCEGN